MPFATSWLILYSTACLDFLTFLASKVDGIPDIVKDGKNGYLIKPSSEAFIKIIKKLKNRQLRNNLGLKAKNYTETYYNWQNTIKGYVKVFKKYEKGSLYFRH